MGLYQGFTQKRAKSKGAQNNLMLTTIQNRVRCSDESSQAIGEEASRQRQAYNRAVEYTLAHPNVTRYRLQAELTHWRQADPEKWAGTLSVQRPGLYRGRDSVRKFHRADAPVLRECRKELEYRSRTDRKPAKPPRHGNNPGRDPDPRRLFQSRKATTNLTIQDAGTIRVISPRTVKVGSMTLRLAWPIPADTDVRAVNIQERESSIRKGQNRNLTDRNYEIDLVVDVPDPEPKLLTAPAVGLDGGMVHTLADSNGQFHDLSIPRLDELQEKVSHLRERQKRLKHGSRRWRKLQQDIRRANRDSGRIRDNWEHHTAREIARQNNIVVVEDLRLSGMMRSARGTSENPGRNVRAKSGLNWGLAKARLGTLRSRIQRQCEKAGGHFIKVNPGYTSTTCPSCGRRDGKNRKNQAVFQCGKCGFSANADTNAAVNVLLRGTQVTLVLAALILAATCRPVAGQAKGKTGRRVGIPPSDDSPAVTPTPTGLERILPGRTGPEPDRRRAQAVEPKQQLLSRLPEAG